MHPNLTLSLGPHESFRDVAPKSNSPLLSGKLLPHWSVQTKEQFQRYTCANQTSLPQKIITVVARLVVLTVAVLLSTPGLSGASPIDVIKDNSPIDGVMKKIWPSIDKRNKLKKSVLSLNEAQYEAVAQFKDTYEQFKKISGFQGGELEKEYKRVEESYNESLKKANAVRSRIKAVNNAAEALFDQWNEDVKQMEDEQLRRNSREQFCQCLTKFDEVRASLKLVEKSMDPVITKFKDVVLALKHRLNAQALDSLTGEVERIQSQVDRLISDMEAAIQEAEKFLTNSPELN